MQGLISAVCTLILMIAYLRGVAMYREKQIKNILSKYDLEIDLDLSEMSVKDTEKKIH